MSKFEIKVYLLVKAVDIEEAKELAFEFLDVTQGEVHNGYSIEKVLFCDKDVVEMLSEKTMTQVEYDELLIATLYEAEEALFEGDRKRAGYKFEIYGKLLSQDFPLNYVPLEVYDIINESFFLPKDVTNGYWHAVRTSLHIV